MNASLLNKYIVILAPYSIFVSTLYLLGYWGAFGINIFEYIGLSDIIKTAIYQLAHYGGFVLLGAAVSEIFLSPLLKNALPPREGADLPEVKFFRRYWILPAVAIVGFALYIALFTESEVRWLLAAIYISPLAVIAVSHFKILSDAIPNEVIRNAVTYPLVTILLFSYGWGTVDARSKKTEKTVIKINGTEENKAYIGRAGGYVFLWNVESKAVEVVMDSTISSLSYVLPKERPPFMTLLQSEKSEGSISNKGIQLMPKDVTN
ncbi:MAG TPA: hypothetical protein VFF26_14595 [Gallionella sp.]|nr:hypothetical protein [Gallionella sp.]